MRWSGATGAIARGKRVYTGCGRKRRSARVWRWICGVKPTPKAGNKPWQHFIVHGLDKPGSSATVSVFAILWLKSHFRMPTDRSIAMSPEFDPIGCFERPLTLAWVPVFLTDPPRRFVRMTALCPAPQVRIEPGIHADEGPFGRYRRIVIAPPPDDGVEAVDEPLLGGGSSVPDFLMPLMEVGVL